MAKFIQLHYENTTVCFRPQDLVSLGADDGYSTNLGILIGGEKGHDMTIPLSYDETVDLLTGAFEAIGEKFEIGVLRVA